MRDQAEDRDNALWTRGELIFRVEQDGPDPDRIVRVEQPYARIGQSADSEILLNGPGVNSRHVYLQLDPRGVFAVDLVTRTGTRFNGFDETSGWLRPGDWLEVDGQRVELVQARIDGVTVTPKDREDDPLAESHSTPLVRLTLESNSGRNGPWSVGSELIFLGWSSACGIQVKDASVAKIHAALFRTRSHAYVIDLGGQPTRINNRPVRGASRLDDGDTLTIGVTPFTVRVQPMLTSSVPALAEPARLIARVIDPELEGPDGASSLELVSESQQALLAWMVETIQQTQGIVLKQQGTLQASLVDLLRQVQQDNATLLNAHLERIQHIDDELAIIRSELSQRTSLPSSTPLPPLPKVTPLRVERKAPETVDPQASTSWLLDRVSQLENENRSAWKDLLGRVAPLPRRTP